MNNEKKEITIYDIAREAGVSTATVSRVLSNSPYVKQEKRERVLALIERYNFRPSALARNLSETRSKMIGMLCPDVRNPYYASLFIECERAAYEKGYTLVLNNTFTREELEVAFIGKLAEQRVECLILCGGIADWRPLPEKYSRSLRQFSKRFPVVVAGRLGMENCREVYIDQGGGMRQAVRHLASLGHRRIAFLHGYNYIYQTQEKLAAFRETMAELGLPIVEDYIVDAGRFDEISGFNGMNRLMGLSEHPTGVIAINDLMAAGAMQSIVRLGYKVPADFSIIGFDDSLITDLTEPHISSVHYDYAAYGQKLIDTAVDAINGAGGPSGVCIPVSLTVKASCRKI